MENVRQMEVNQVEEAELDGVGQGPVPCRTDGDPSLGNDGDHSLGDVGKGLVPFRTVVADHGTSGASPDSTLPSAEGEGRDEGEAQLRAEMAEMERRMVEAYRRALLAENAGRVVPELVAGATAEELDASVEAATAAYAAVREATLAQVAASARVSATNGARADGASDVEAMSALEKIAHGLRRE